MIATIKAINKQLRSDTGINVIQANSKGPVPALPYGVYNITSPYIKGTGREDSSYYESNNELNLNRYEEFRVTLSINTYGTTNENAIDLALQIRKWFLFYGEDFLSSLNVVLIEATAIENRTTFLVDSYEYKHGFDVQLRMIDIDNGIVDWIEKAEIEMEE